MTDDKQWTYLPLHRGLMWVSTEGDRHGWGFKDPGELMEPESAAEHALINLLSTLPPELRQHLDGYEIDFSEHRFDQKLHELEGHDD